MKKIFLQFFTWWNGQTLGTRLYTWRHGTKIGTDEFGNIYYETRKKLDGRNRRWVIFNGYSEATSIGSGWHGWMHHRTNVAPSQEDYQPRAWQTQHKKNLTGTDASYRKFNPKTNKSGQVPQDYDAWTPNQS
jgi:NADH:ubiquinone oxidoreductase subunit